MIPIDIDLNSEVPIYLQIKEQIRGGVAAGSLRCGDKLASVRELAVNLRVNPNTVARAYRELETEGFLESRKGQGTFIGETSRPLSVTERTSILEEAMDIVIRKALKLRLPIEALTELMEERYQWLSQASTPDTDPATEPTDRLRSGPGTRSTREP